MHQKNIITAGQPLAPNNKVLIMIHGRGGTAEDILSLSSYLNVKDFSFLAPQATGHSWYPYSFLMPPSSNEPWLSSAIGLLEELVDDITARGIATEQIYFLGFSQGACLTLEFVTRHAQRYGGVVAFTGGLIGDTIYAGNYQGDFHNTPVFIGTSNPDPHVPVQRVHDTTSLMKNMHAHVTEKIYNGMGHTINQDELDLANKLIFDRQELQATA